MRKFLYLSFNIDFNIRDAYVFLYKEATLIVKICK